MPARPKRKLQLDELEEYARLPSTSTRLGLGAWLGASGSGITAGQAESNYIRKNKIEKAEMGAVVIEHNSGKEKDGDVGVQILSTVQVADGKIIGRTIELFE
ncbi:hypothetical protein C8J56DRAFT_898964 [Mycena floridula]|nr:hypothetical protein C8J56DRAFT_898964 [Mycena floridula]